MRTYLTNGYTIKNKENRTYSVTEKMGEGASCIAYYVIDEQIKEKRVIKEYYPINIPIVRSDDGEIICSTAETDKFNRGKERFKTAIERQSKLRNNDSTMNQTVSVLEQFEANGTLYVIVPQYSGHTYADNSKIDLYDRIRICKSVAEYVRNCHAEGYLCLDIKPDNIFVIPETSELAMFFDFDSVCRIDEVMYVENLSYTDSWAAPEQIVPGSYVKISEATDIFVLGELLYWSIFDGHSSPHEYRRHSHFDYSKSRFESLLTNDAEDILTDIFHHTLRSSVNNRYNSVTELIERISDLLKEIYPGKCCLINAFLPPTSCFIGRKSELEQVNRKLEEGNLAILTGVGGIGKSEIAKKYIEIYKSSYKTIIYLTYSFDLVSTINGTTFLSDFEQKDEESDIHYCNRKISKLAELFSGKNLIIIDNLNLEIEELEHKDIWERLCTLPCDLIITSRCNQEQYFGQQIYINGMREENLKTLFYSHCSYDEAQESSVSEIIQSVQGHTLVVELIAKQARSCIKTPSEMLELLEQKGILGLNTEDVKWDRKKKTVAEHVRGLFSVFSISERQKELLFMMAFMPVSGVDEKVFFDFFKLDNHNDLRYLIDNGWITEQEGMIRKIAVHPVITSVVMDVIQDDRNIAKAVYNNAIKSMLKWSKKENVNQDEFLYICNSLAIQTSEYEINNILAADYIIRYNDCFAKYGNEDKRRQLIRYAIDVYNQIYPENEYAAVRERAYESYVESIYDIDHYDEVRDMCQKHLKLAKRNKDLYMASRWYLMLYYASYIKNIIARGYSLMFLIYFIRISNLEERLWKESKKKNSKILSEKYLKKLHYGYMITWKNYLHEMVYISLAVCCEEFSDNNNVFYTKEKWSETNNLEQALAIRNRYKDAHTINATDNSIIKNIDVAKLAILSRSYEEATNTLLPIIDYFNEHNIPSDSNLYSVHAMLATIALTVEDYEKAIEHYIECLEIAKELNYKYNYDVRIGLARAYLYHGDINEAKDINYRLFVDLKEVDKDNRGTFFAEMYYNTACIHKNLGDRERAEEFFLHAIVQFKSCSLYGNRRDVGIARCQYQLGNILYEEKTEEAISDFSNAHKTFVKCLGDKHIETKRCREMLDKCKTYSRK